MKEHINFLTKKDIENTCVRNVIWYALGLEEAIKKDDLVTMRRHTWQLDETSNISSTYLQSFKDCAERVRNIQPAQFTKAIQLNLFS